MITSEEIIDYLMPRNAFFAMLVMNGNDNAEIIVDEIVEYVNGLIDCENRN